MIVENESPAGCALLIVEPEPMVARILEHKLRREGHRVEWQRDGAAAAGRMSQADIALVDVTVDGDGIAWMAGVTAPRVGWLAICEQGDLEAPRRAVRAGAAGIIARPFKPTAVAARVATLLGLRRQ